MSRPITPQQRVDRLPDQGDPLNQYDPARLGLEYAKRSRTVIARLTGQLYKLALSGGLGLFSVYREAVCGWAGVQQNEGTVNPRQIIAPISIPPNVFEWSLMIHIKLVDNGAGTVQDMKIELFDPDLGAVQILYWPIASGAGVGQTNIGTTEQHLYITGLLGTSFRPPAGEVKQAQIRITSTKTAPRSGVTVDDGCFQCVLTVF